MLHSQNNSTPNNSQNIYQRDPNLPQLNASHITQYDPNSNLNNWKDFLDAYLEHTRLAMSNIESRSLSFVVDHFGNLFSLFLSLLDSQHSDQEFESLVSIGNQIFNPLSEFSLFKIVLLIERYHFLFFFDFKIIFR